VTRIGHKVGPPAVSTENMDDDAELGSFPFPKECIMPGNGKKEPERSVESK